MTELIDFIEPVRNFYDQIFDGIVITNLDGKVRYVNSAACELLHCKTKAKFKDATIDSCFEEKNLIQKTLIKLATANSIIENKTCNRRDGSKENFVICFSMVSNAKSEPIGLQVIFKNPKKSKEEEKLFETRSSLLRSLNFQSREVVLISDLKNKKNIFCTQSIEKITGWSTKEFIEGGWAFAMSITHPEDAKRITEQFLKEIALRNSKKSIDYQKPFNLEYRKRHKNGTWMWMNSECIVLERDANYNPNFIITFLKDASIAKNRNGKANEELESSIEMELETIFLSGKKKSTSTPIQLSKREKEILLLVRDGLSTKEIADILGLKPTSVNSYRKNLMIKLKAKNSAELVQKSNQFTLI